MREAFLEGSPLLTHFSVEVRTWEYIREDDQRAMSCLACTV
jgi:hypothetical protein